MTKVIKNIERGSMKEYAIDEGFFLLKIQNNTDENQQFIRKIENNFIQFHYCLQGKAKFNFNDGRYSFDIQKEQLLLLYNPSTSLPLNLDLSQKSQLISLIISINRFHALFSKEADYIHFLNQETKDKKFYDNKPINSSMLVVLNQIVSHKIHSSIEKLYLKGKAFELLSLHFNHTDDVDTEQCPFLVDEQNVLKIKKAKEIIISRMTEPPTLQELADEVELSLKRLKDGFKQIYGTTVFNFLLDHKMEYARKLLETNQYNINEVSLKIGYSTASHFIVAFKKKYGVTPKKYIQ